MMRAGACLKLLHSVLHVKRSMLTKIDKPDIPQLVPIMVHSSGVYWAQLQLLPLQVNLKHKCSALLGCTYSMYIPLQ